MFCGKVITISSNINTAKSKKCFWSITFIFKFTIYQVISSSNSSTCIIINPVRLKITMLQNKFHIYDCIKTKHYQQVRLKFFTRSDSLVFRIIVGKEGYYSKVHSFLIRNPDIRYLPANDDSINSCR